MRDTIYLIEKWYEVGDAEVVDDPNLSSLTNSESEMFVCAHFPSTRKGVHTGVDMLGIFKN